MAKRAGEQRLKELIDTAALFFIAALMAKWEYAEDIGSLSEEDWTLAFQDLARQTLGMKG